MYKISLHIGDCIDILPKIESGSVDAIIADPPYPMIKRSYGMMTEADWMAMMQEVVRQSRRILKPTGSAVFILQPNSEKVGKMRPWLWKFMAWCCEEWNIIQDAYWWNTTTMPQGSEKRGLLRSSVKPCVWLGEPGCYRAQNRVLWQESERNAQRRAEARASNDNEINYSAGDVHCRELRARNRAAQRGGVTPFNLLPMANANSANSAGSHGHGAGTPQALTDWWVRYLCPTGGVVADWFMGSGTTGLSAIKYGNSFVGIERDENYFNIAKKRIAFENNDTIVVKEKYD